MDIFSDNRWRDLRHRIDTERAGPFVFEPGVAIDDLTLPYQRIIDAHARFCSSPLSQVARELERETIASSVFGTNSIEGGTLSESETEAALDIEPDAARSIEQRRAANIRTAYETAEAAARQSDWHLDVSFITRIHAEITDQLPHPRNRPGLLRDNPKAVVTRVGNAEHGGVYKPPQNGRDVAALLQALVEWHDDLAQAGVPALIRAPLMHYYFELVHPFWDGNGRVGRVLEATLLLHDGFHYAPFAMSRFYLNEIDEYFALFNRTRKQAAKNLDHPNQDFVRFFLEGMHRSIEHLHDRVNDLVMTLLYRNTLAARADDKTINKRQYAIACAVLEHGRPLTLRDLQSTAWYKALYAKLTPKTRQRDLRQLREQALIKIKQHPFCKFAILTLA